MSTRETISKEIEENQKLVQEIKKEIEVILNDLKNDSLSEEETEELEEKLQNLDAEVIDISTDIAILQEMIDRCEIDETYCGMRCDGRCQICIKYTEGYDPFDEI